MSIQGFMATFIPNIPNPDAFIVRCADNIFSIWMKNYPTYPVIVTTLKNNYINFGDCTGNLEELP